MRSNFAWLVFLSGFFLCAPTSAQWQNIIIDSGRNNGSYYYFLPPEEPCIAMDFKHPNNLVAGSNLINFYISTNGGYTWFRDSLHTALGNGGDPVTTVDTNGFFFYVHLGGSRDNGVVCQKLNNITTHVWTNGVYPGLADTPKFEDKPWVVADRNNNALYLTWSLYDKFYTTNPADSTNIYFSKSVDAGSTWSAPTRISKMWGDCSNESNSVEGAMPCAGPHSEIYVAWAHNDAILFNRSFDGGSTWLDSEIEVSNSPGGWYYNDIPGIFRSPGLPFIACDNSSGPFKGTVYVNWYDQRNGVNNTDIWVSKSTDSGNTWSSAVKVNDDIGAAEQFMSSMTVDPVTGYIYVLFYDRRNYTDSTTDVYLAVSEDGAATFKNFKISEAPFTPARSNFFGDYTDIVAFNNIVRPIWYAQVQISPGLFDSKIITAIIDSSITGTPLIAHQDGCNLQTYPNPFHESTQIAYDLGAAEAVSLFVTDITGRTVALFRDNELMSEGRHTEQYNAGNYNLAPGIYLLCLRSRDYCRTVKMVYKQ